MVGIEKITRRISEDVQQEIDKLNAETMKQVEEIAARYHAQANKESEELLERGKKTAVEREERLRSVAELEARKLELATKQELLERAYDSALAALLALSEEEYTDILVKLCRQGVRTGKEEVIFSQKDRTRVGKQVVTRVNEALGAQGALTLSTETRPLNGGFILSDGSVEVNCAFETLIRLKRGVMDKEVARVLFG